MAVDSTNRPVFPARAVITAGMPYGNKNLLVFLYQQTSLLVFCVTA